MLSQKREVEVQSSVKSSFYSELDHLLYEP